MVVSRLSSTTTVDLGARGFSTVEAQRLLALKERFDRGLLHESTREERRLQFVRWLVERGYLNEGVSVGRVVSEARDADGGGADGGDTEGGGPWTTRLWRSLAPSRP